LAVWLVMAYLWLIGVAVAVLLAGVLLGARRMRRKYAPVAQVLPWETRAALPPPEAAQVTARPARALPAPELHIHYHAPPQRTGAEIRGEFLAAWDQFVDPGSLTAEEAAEVAAYRAFPDH